MPNKDLKPRWVKGESGNPNGRPKGKKNGATLLRELLELDDNELKMHMAQIKKAIDKEDTSAYKSVLERAYGMPKQQTDITTDGEKINNNVTPISFIKSIDDSDK